MNMDRATLELLRHQHPAWQLLCAHHAPLVASFLHAVFVEPNVRSVSQAELGEALEDRLYLLREEGDVESFPRHGLEYLNDWAQSERGWLRKFYPQGSDEPHFELTPATEKALAWLAQLTDRPFVGTESRLLTVFELLKQMSYGTEADPDVRVRELERQRDEIDEQIARIQAGEVSLMDDVAVRERFQQFQAMARELLADFRELEHNFRMLDRSVREKIALFDGSKGELLDEIISDHDLISDSDQGRSFQAFWEFLMSQPRQEELTQLLDKVLGLPALAEDRPDPRLRRIHHDWLESGEHTQRMVARLSQQLRRFLDDRAWLENRRIFEILSGLEARALAARDDQPSGHFMEVDGLGTRVELPMERKLFSPPTRPVIAGSPLESGEVELDASALYDLAIVDKAELAERVRRSLQSRSQITLRELVAAHPLRYGLAELVGYLQVASEQRDSVIDEDTVDVVEWSAGGSLSRRARLPRVIFVRA